MKTSNLEGRTGQRRYNGNPLAFFRANSSLYGGMSRRDLSIFDSGMYRALGRAGQLEEAIQANELHVEAGRKGGKREIISSRNKINEIINAYTIHDGNALEASRHLLYSVTTIWEIWKKEGLYAQGRKRNLTESEQKKIIESYEPSDGNAHRVSKDLFYSIGTIIKCWRNAGLEIRKVGRSKTI